MQFSEDDLRAALERKQPAEGFAQRVKDRISRAETKAKPLPQKRQGFFASWWQLKPRPALAFAMTAVLLAAGSWIGYRQYQQHVIKVQIEREREEMAARQVIRALRITSAKLNHVFQKVNGSLPQDGTTRRQIL